MSLHRCRQHQLLEVGEDGPGTLVPLPKYSDCIKRFLLEISFWSENRYVFWDEGIAERVFEELRRSFFLLIVRESDFFFYKWRVKLALIEIGGGLNNASDMEN